jgi:hypothetical protein
LERIAITAEAIAACIARRFAAALRGDSLRRSDGTSCGSAMTSFDSVARSLAAMTTDALPGLASPRNVVCTRATFVSSAV